MNRRFLLKSLVAVLAAPAALLKGKSEPTYHLYKSSCDSSNWDYNGPMRPLAGSVQKVVHGDNFIMVTFERGVYLYDGRSWWPIVVALPDA